PAVIPFALVLVLRLAAGIALIVLSRTIATRLRYAASPAGEDASVGDLVRELVAAGGTLGIRRVTDLALAIKTEAEGVAKRVVRSSIDAMISAVEKSRPDFSGATAADGTVTIVFSDMEGFSSMTQRLGDEQAHEIIKSHNRIVRGAVKAHRGQEVELQGDGFLLAFPQAEQAVRCALQIQDGCARYSGENPGEPIRVRIGLAVGKPIKDRERFFGITVILAARIASQARGGETLVSEKIHDALAAHGEFRFDEGRVAPLKGLEGTHRMYAVLADGG
ncbi:MAG TPA: adenylate/guanylate cyclase domain-containing protein, partial [Nevskiaceae bacterium]|nr:adenylate/guanylate cyclase domain-containing protein [Nevskiaceae bacterium]